MTDLTATAARWRFITLCSGCRQSIATCACIPGGWRCGICGAWIEMRDPRPWPDHCGQRTQWVSSDQRTRDDFIVAEQEHADEPAGGTRIVDHT